MNDKEAAEFYASPDALQAGRRVTPPPTVRPSMSGHVPVRFPQSTISEIKRIAAEDGVTVSNWIRRLVDEEVARRTPPQTNVSTKDTTTVNFDFEIATVPGNSTGVADELAKA